MDVEITQVSKYHSSSIYYHAYFFWSTFFLKHIWSTFFFGQHVYVVLQHAHAPVGFFSLKDFILGFSFPTPLFFYGNFYLHKCFSSPPQMFFLKDEFTPVASLLSIPFDQFSHLTETFFFGQTHLTET